MTLPTLTLLCDLPYAAAWAEDLSRIEQMAATNNPRGLKPPFAATVRVVDEAEARELNVQFRSKDYVPDVLSFPTDNDDAWDEEEGWTYLGDIAVCGPIVTAEAAARGWDEAVMGRHLVVHGLLHLLGHDHMVAAEAAAMEAAETAWLGRIGDPDPYTAPMKEGN